MVAAERAKGLVVANDGLVPVANRPLTLYGLDSMRSAGIREVCILATPSLADELRTLIGEEFGGGMRIRYRARPENPDAKAGELLATAAPVLDGSPCVAQLRHGLLRGDIGPYVEELVRDDLDALLLLDQAVSGPTSLEDQRLLRLVDAESAGHLAGVHVLGPRLIDEASRGGSLAELLDRVIAAGGRARQRVFTGSWKEVACSDDLLEANRLVLDDLHPAPWRGELTESRVDGRVSIGDGAVLESTVVRGPVVIGSGARLRHAYVGPYTSIGDEVEIEGAEIEHSIVLPGAEIKHLGGRLEASVVGRGAKLFRDFALPRAMRVRLADGDEIALG